MTHCPSCAHPTSQHLPVQGVVTCTHVTKRGGASKREFCLCKSLNNKPLEGA